MSRQRLGFYVGEDTPLKQKATILEVSLGLVKDTV